MATARNALQQQVRLLESGIDKEAAYAESVDHILREILVVLDQYLEQGMLACNATDGDDLATWIASWNHRRHAAAEAYRCDEHRT